MTQDELAAAFDAHRGLLFTVAYELVGISADAEDVVQDAWLRWAALDESARAEVRDPRAYLVRIVTRVGLNRLRTLSRRRETYVGPWLPEPLLTAPDVADDVALSDAASTAMLVVLETLAPTERAVFVLREVFAVEYDEIAAAVDRSPAAVRQIAHRAREHVQARRPRGVATRDEQRRVVETFARAAASGDLQVLLDVIAPDVVLVTDGGGLKSAARRPIEGLDKVLRFLAGISAGRTPAVDVVEICGNPALRWFDEDGVLDSVFTAHVDHGRATHLYVVRNPEKLAALDRPVLLER